MGATTMLHVRLGEQVKEHASAALEAMGLSILTLCAPCSCGWRPKRRCPLPRESLTPPRVPPLKKPMKWCGPAGPVSPRALT